MKNNYYILFKNAFFWLYVGTFVASFIYFIIKYIPV